MKISSQKLVAIFLPVLSMIAWSGNALYHELLCGCYDWKFYFALISFMIFFSFGLFSAFIIIRHNQNKHEI